MRTMYLSDISREQFARILPLLEGARKKTRSGKIVIRYWICEPLKAVVVEQNH